jgi:hypothetical protein
MANQRNSDNPPNDVDRDREAPWKAEFQEFQQTMREMMERMHMGPNRNHRDNDAHDDDGIRVRPILHRQLAPINRPLVY